jgi:DNA-binding NarL/FixJ family response regulator
MRTLLVDDHAMFVHGMRFLLESLQPDMHCTTATSIREGLEQQGPFDWVLLDYQLPDAQGHDGLTRMLETYPESVVVVVSGVEDPDVVRQLIELGAAGFVPKAASAAALMAAMQTILGGGVYLPSFAHESTPLAPMPLNLSELLTPRQLACVLKLVQGKSNKLIARDLGLAESSVKTHLSGAFKTLGVGNRTEAVFRMAALGLTPPDAPPT